MRSVGVTGHQKAPHEAWALLYEALPPIFGPLPFTGVSSLAAGADQRFAEDVLRLGGSLIAVIPSKGYERSFETEAERARYHLLLRGATRQVRLPFEVPCEEAYLAAGRCVADLSDTLVAVWDGLPAKGKGGTADIVEYALSQGKDVRIVWPPGASR